MGVKCQQSLVLECDCGRKVTYSAEVNFQALQMLARNDGWEFPNVAICTCPDCKKKKGRGRGEE